MMARQKPTLKSNHRKRPVLVSFAFAAILVLFLAAILWVLPELKPSWLPPQPWLKPVSIILGALAIAIPVLGSLFSDILLPLIDRSESSPSPGAKELRDAAPLLPVTYDTLIKGLGNGGEIPWIERGMASLSLLHQHDRIAVVGPMKSGKTREALELIRIAERNGLVSRVFQPAGAINVIDPDLLASAVAVQLDQPCLFFIDDIGVLQDEAYLTRLSICIDTIARVRPDARFVITLQIERLQLSESLQVWVDKHRFHRISPPDLTADQRHELAESGTTTLKAALTPEAVAVLGNDVELVRPWDIVWVLQAALDRKANKLPLTERDVEALLAEGEQAVWARQRQNLIMAESAAEQLLESIGIFFSAGVTPRESSILRYAAYRMPSHVRQGQKRLHLRQATDFLQQYAIVATKGLYAIPEPRLLPLIIDTGRARGQLNAFMAAYNPEFWTSLTVHALRPFDFIVGLPSLVRLFSRLSRWRVIRNLWMHMSRPLEAVYAWPADQALLAAELGSPQSASSLLSSAVMSERGRLALEAGSYRTALEQLNMAIALNPTNSWALALRGETYHRLYQFDKAVADFDRAIELAPKSVWSLTNRGVTYQQMGHEQKGMNDILQAVRLDPMLAGQTYQASHDYFFKDEVEQMEAALHLTGDMHTRAHSFTLRGIVWAIQGEYAHALDCFNHAVTFAPKDASIIAWRGLIHRQQGNYELALADFDQAIVLKTNAWYLYGRALTQRALGQEDAAAADLCIAINGTRETEAKTPDDWQNKLNLALYCLASADRTAAEDLYQATIDAGVAEWRARGAIQDLNDYLHLFPPDEAARKIRERLQEYIKSRFPKMDKKADPTPG